MVTPPSIDELIDELDDPQVKNRIAVNHADSLRYTNVSDDTYLLGGNGRTTNHKVRQSHLFDHPVIEAATPLTVIKYGTRHGEKTISLDAGEDTLAIKPRQIHRFVKQGTREPFPTRVNIHGSEIGLTNPTYQLLFETAHYTQRTGFEPRNDAWDAFIQEFNPYGLAPMQTNRPVRNNSDT